MFRANVSQVRLATLSPWLSGQQWAHHQRWHFVTGISHYIQMKQWEEHSFQLINCLLQGLSKIVCPSFFYFKWEISDRRSDFFCLFTPDGHWYGPAGFCARFTCPPRLQYLTSAIMPSLSLQNLVLGRPLLLWYLMWWTLKAGPHQPYFHPSVTDGAHSFLFLARNRQIFLQ